jgi:hypothetical protein
MGVMGEIADVMRMLGEIVKSTSEIVKAANDGRQFLASRHPDAQQDLAELLGQMHRAIEGLVAVTRVIAGFRFVYDDRLSVDSQTAHRELVRFNDYVMEQRREISTLQTHIHDLKADCDKVRALRDKLDALTKTGIWGSMFHLLGPEGRERATELHSALSSFYADDQRMITLIEQTLDVARQAVEEVENTLGPPGTANPYNLPAAAEVLRLYAVVFDRPEHELENLAKALNDARIALRP